MKKVLSILICALILLTAACGLDSVTIPADAAEKPSVSADTPEQADPSSDVPEETDFEGTDSKILADIKSVPFVKIDAPAHVSESCDYDDMRVRFDADVSLPDAIAYPVLQVKKRVFTDDEILAMIELLTGTSEKIYPYPYNRSKAVWQAMLDEAKQYEGTERVTDEYIDFLEEYVASAGVEAHNTPADFSNTALKDIGNIYIPTSDNMAAYFTIFPTMTGFAYSRDEFTNVFPAHMTDESQFDANSDTKEHFNWLKPGEPELSQEDAYQTAADFLKKMNIELTEYEAEPCSIIRNAVDKHTGWTFTFTRDVSGLPLGHNNAGEFISPDLMPVYVSGWGSEYAQISVDKDGVCGFMVNGLSASPKTVIPSAQLMPFDADLQKLIADALHTMYASHGIDTGSDQRREIVVTSIKLGTSLVSDREENADMGYYIPSWFVDYAFTSGGRLSTSQIVFSAIDGSYINPGITNEDINFMGGSAYGGAGKSL